MRHVQVTHIYVLPVPDGDVDIIDPIINSGVSMMETFIANRAVNIRDLRSDWQLMPKEYSDKIPQVEGTDDVSISPGRTPKRYDQDPNMTEEEKERDSILSKQIIEADADAGISFVGDVMGEKFRVVHPWEQGLSIFPEDHPLRPFEDKLRRDNEEEALEAMQALAPKLKELPPGDDDVVHEGDIEDGETLP